MEVKENNAEAARVFRHFGTGTRAGRDGQSGYPGTAPLVWQIDANR
jgi:hypothetical protein